MNHHRVSASPYIPWLCLADLSQQNPMRIGIEIVIRVLNQECDGMKAILTVIGIEANRYRRAYSEKRLLHINSGSDTHERRTSQCAILSFGTRSGESQGFKPLSSRIIIIHVPEFFTVSR